MPFEQTITIINNSGKIISTGKHLVGIFKEARSAYKEKKETLRQERPPGIQRARTFDSPRGEDCHGPIIEIEEYDDGRRYDGDSGGLGRTQRSLGPAHVPLFLEGAPHGRRFSVDDGERRSQTSERRRHRPQRSSSGRDSISNTPGSNYRTSKPPLTAHNLRALSEASASRPSGASKPSPPHPYDMVLSQRGPRHANAHRTPAAVPAASISNGGSPSTVVPSPRVSLMVHRPRSNPALGSHFGGSEGMPPFKTIDMDLAYGNIPPDLESRNDLNPDTSTVDGPTGSKETQARSLVERIEMLLNEAQCVHHTAASIICHLQDNPEAAAAVALTLAELSALLSKLSPAFLGVVKGGSPAVFALLASPQFLIGTSIVVGVTVVLFGGWKIVKRISEVRSSREEEKLAFETDALGSAKERLQNTPGNVSGATLESNRTPDVSSRLSSHGYDEALVLEEELSTIETWRRGIEPAYNEASGTEPWSGCEVDVELISPEAMRSRIGDDGQFTTRSSRTAKARGDGMVPQRSHNHHRQKHHGDGTRKHKELRAKTVSPDVPQRRSSKIFLSAETDNCPSSGQSHYFEEAASDSGVSTTSRSSRHSRRSRRGNDGPSNRSGPGGPASDAGTSKSKSSKKTANNGSNMLKQLFKRKKGKDDKENGEVIV